MKVWLSADAKFPDGRLTEVEALILNLELGSQVKEIAALRAREPALRIYVRVSPLTVSEIDADLDAVMAARPDGILLAKVTSGADLSHLGAKLAVREAELGLNDGGTRIIAMIDSAKGLFGLASLSGASHRLDALAWDPHAIARDAGLAGPLDEEGALHDVCRTARSLVLLGAAAVGVDAVDMGNAPGASGGFKAKIVTDPNFSQT
jgi:citrate lyase subunit beta/citryl-CoA lyase